MNLFKINIKNLSDEALMGRLIKNNDPKALSELYNRYAKKLLGYFINMFKGDVEKAEDFLHDLFIKLMDKKHLFDTKRKFYTWVFTIASNMCKSEFRKPIIRSLADESDYEHHSYLHTEDELKMAAKHFKASLRHCINDLSHEHKVVFILRYHQHFSLQDIADIAETNVGTVKSRLFYATKKITKQLHAYQPDDDSKQFKMN